jgi:tetratricopeptide (TPR) repeat protein
MDFDVVASTESPGGDDAHNSADAVRYIQVMQERGMAQARAGDCQALNTLDELAAMAARNEIPWFWAIAVEAKARALAILGDLDGAIVVAAHAASAYHSAHDPQSAAIIQRFAAQALIAQGRFKPAVKILRTVERNARNDHRTRDAAAFELADCLDRLGQKRRAAAARARAGNAQR